MSAATESRLSRYRLYYEAPPRGEETRRTIEQLKHALSKGWKRVMPLMPYLGRRKR